MIFQISSKIIHVRSGGEVGLKFDEFVEHFQKFGSPVMIGKNIHLYINYTILLSHS